MPIHKNKTVWLLVAMKNNCLLLKKNFHEGRDILQLPGSSSKKDFNILVSNLFGIRYIDQLTDFGVIQNTIVKTDEIVDLHINICRLDITDQHGIDFGDNYEWSY